MSNKPFLFTPGSMDKLQHAVEVDEERSDRIRNKYQKLVDHGLYENNDLRSFSNSLWNAIVHFDDKTLYVFTYPIISASPACYIKTCSCGTVVFKELLDDVDFKGVLDLEDVLDAIQLTLDFAGDEVGADLPQIPFNHPYLKQTKEAD